DQPGTGDAVDLRPRPRDPDGAAAPIAFGNLVGGDGRQFCLLPAHLTAFEGLGGDAVVAEPGRRAFAELLSLVADNHNRLAGETCRPVLDVAMGAAACAGNESWISREVEDWARSEEHTSELQSL